MNFSTDDRLHHPFEPVVSDQCCFLILGSFPSIRSFENDFYYGHSRNQFWEILSQVFPESDFVKANQDGKIALLKKHRIALWDVFGSARRKKQDSSDGSLVDRVLNNFASFLKKYPSIRKIAINSTDAKKDFEQGFWESWDQTSRIELCNLPSPSPRNTAGLQEKVEAYRSFLEVGNPQSRKR